ncbi:PAS domain S-box protein [Nocardiopsis algeriensis]|uniref:histidine kinase n=1 Tax=Nocardiopsis algeriensis TaxID=1478215 RepID=A0A841J118_9ACTN|nr:PAS domain S-box-containing protein [Nocardiopsis algeriensis]
MSSERGFLSAEAVLASSADAVVGLDSELRVCLWNPAAERLFGWREQEVLGGELPIVPAELKAEHGAVLEQVRAGTPLTIHTRRVRRDSSAIDVRISTSSVPAADGGHGGWVLNVYPTDTEVQAQASAMERARLVRRLTDVLADINADLSLGSVLDRISNGITELTGAEAGGFVLLDEDRVELVSTSRMPKDLRGYSTPLEGSLFGELLGSGKSVLLANDDTRGLQGLAWADLPGLHTIALCVSNVHGRPYGALYALYSRRKVGHVELELFELLAAHAGVAIGNAQAYEELQRQRVHEQAVADSSADGIAVLDAGGRVRKWNRSAVELTGYPADTVEGRHPPFPLPACHGRPIKHRLEDGRWLEILMARIPPTHEWVVDFRDITAQKAMEDERETFLATTGHELRTPITAIHGFATTLVRKWSRMSSEAQLEAVRNIVDRSTALTLLVERLSLGSEAVRGEMDVDPGMFDLGRVLRQAVTTFRSLSERHEVVLSSPPEEVPEVFADPLATGIIMDQLLDNSIKFSPDGGTIRVSAVPEGGFVAVSVDDEGLGLGPGDEEKVFDRFFQGGVRGDRRRFGGLGLGLYIVRKLARDQGGDVRVVRLERGTRMCFTLPLFPGAGAEPDGPPESVVEEPGVAAVRAGVTGGMPSLKKSHGSPHAHEVPKISQSPEALPRQRSRGSGTGRHR